MKHPFAVPSSPRTRITKSRAGENLIWFSTLGLLAACAQAAETTEAEAPATGAGNTDIVPDLTPVGASEPISVGAPEPAPAGDNPDLKPVNDDPEAVENYDETHHLGGRLGNVDTEVKIDFALESLFSNEEGLDVSTIDPSTIKVLSAPTGAGWDSNTGTLHVPQGTSGKVVVSVLDVATGEERLFAFDFAEPDSPGTDDDDSSDDGLLPPDFLTESVEDDDFSQEFLDSLTDKQIEAIESGDYAIEDFVRSLTPSQLRLLLPGEEIISEEPGEITTMDFSALSDESLELLLVLAFQDEEDEEFSLSPEEARDFLFDVFDTMSVNGVGFLDAMAGDDLLISSLFDQMRTEDLSQATWDSIEDAGTPTSVFLLEMRDSFLAFDYDENIVMYDPNGEGLPPLPPTVGRAGELALNEWQEGYLEAGEEAETWDIDLDPGTYRIFVQQQYTSLYGDGALEHNYNITASDDDYSTTPYPYDDNIPTLPSSSTTDIDDDFDDQDTSPPFHGYRDWYNISISGEGAANKGPSLYFSTNDWTDSGYYAEIVVDSQGQFEVTVDTSTDYYYDDYYTSYYSDDGIAYPEPDWAWGLPAQGYDIFLQDLGQDKRIDYAQDGSFVAHGELHYAYVDKEEVPYSFIFGGGSAPKVMTPSKEGMQVFRSIYSDGAGVVEDELDDSGNIFGFADTLDEGDIVEIVIDNFSSPFGDGGSVTVFGDAVTAKNPTTGSITPIYSTSLRGAQSSYVFEAGQTGDIWASVNASEFAIFDFSISYLFNQEDFGTFSLNAGENLDLYAEIGDDIAGLELKGSTEDFRVDANGILHTTSLSKGGVHELMLAGETTDGVQVEYSFDLDVNGVPVWTNPESGWKITRGKDFSIELAKALDDDPVTYELLDISESTLEFDPKTLKLSGNYAGDADELTVRYNATDGVHTIEREISLEVVEPETLTIDAVAGEYARIEFALDAGEKPLDTDNPLELLVDGKAFEVGYYDASSHSYVANIGMGVPFLSTLNLEIKTVSAGKFLTTSTNPYDDFKFDGDTPSEFTSIIFDLVDNGGPYSQPQSVREFTGRDEAPDNYALHAIHNDGIEKIFGIDDDLIFEEQNEYELISITSYWETW